MYKYSAVVILFQCFLTVVTQSYEDRRCICVCPSPSVVLNRTASVDRRPYIANVPPHQCNCDGVILPHVGEEIKGQEQEFCPLCDCKYESRNTTVIKVVVIIVLWVIALLFVYMGFLVLLVPLIRKKRRVVYTPLHTEEAHTLLEYNEDDLL